MATSMRVLVWIIVVCETALTYVHGDCSEISAFGVSPDDQQFIVDMHNHIRLMIAKGELIGQPMGTNLKRLQWDDTLAQRAQEFTDICMRTFHSLDDETYDVGQTLFVTSSNVEGSDWQDVIDRWFSEHKKYTYPSCKLSTKRYTQMVWANTRYVGCGYSSYHAANDTKFKVIYVCHYSPKGNIEGEEPYALDGPECNNLC